MSVMEQQAKTCTSFSLGKGISRVLGWSDGQLSPVCPNGSVKDKSRLARGGFRTLVYATDAKWLHFSIENVNRSLLGWRMLPLQLQFFRPAPTMRILSTIPDSDQHLHTEPCGGRHTVCLLSPFTHLQLRKSRLLALGELTCRWIRFQFYSNLHGSILFLTCISVQRYLGICHPLSPWLRRAGRKLAWAVCASVWIIVTFLCAPTFVFAATGIQRNRTVCYDLSVPERSRQYYPYGMTLTCLGFLLPFMVIVVLYCKMARVLFQPDDASGAAAKEKKCRAVRMIAIVVLVFAVSFLPFHVTKTLYLIVRTLPDAPCHLRNFLSVVYKSTRPFASMNSVLDPILFYFTKPKFRRGTRSLLLRITTLRDNSKQEERTPQSLLNKKT
ncbi:hypothetical protein HF521_003979 [Silurus meridionalis]|uniref:G-protein coupled receptors family 1 profile domain-containing protein n=1 Tax=Silurus meridionalis TaxID=175797 RepID=A0A8T0AZV6_SILME|nr:hypothetical protein HF521_003979 [Silurus meridionalis]